jgi:hypothetical protein
MAKREAQEDAEAEAAAALEADLQDFFASEDAGTSAVRPARGAHAAGVAEQPRAAAAGTTSALQSAGRGSVGAAAAGVGHSDDGEEDDGSYEHGGDGDGDDDDPPPIPAEEDFS